MYVLVLTKDIARLQTSKMAAINWSCMFNFPLKAILGFVPFKNKFSLLANHFKCSLKSVFVSFKTATHYFSDTFCFPEYRRFILVYNVRASNFMEYLVHV